MRKIDDIRKSIYIIVGILTIISLVFTLCKKIGFCASSESGLDYLPFSPSESNYSAGVSKPVTYSQFLEDLTNTNQVDISQGCLIRWANDNGTIYYYVYHNLPSNFTCCSSSTYNSAYFMTNTQVDFEFHHVSDIYCFTSSNYNFSTYKYIGSTLTRQSTGSYNYFTLNVDRLLKIFYSSNDFYNLGSGSPELFFDNESNNSPDVPIGHTKGGVMSNLADSYILIEDFDGPGFDDSPPSDSSSIPAWLSKILTGLGSLNTTLQSGVLTLGDYIGAGIEKLENKISEIKDLIAGIYNWFTEDFDKNEFQTGLYSIPLISDLMGVYSMVQNCGIFDWSDVTPAQTVSFTFDFGGAVLPHSTNTIDFSWYTGTVKSICNLLICTFLVLGLLVTVINQIPNIIGGHSGDRGGGSDS